VSLKPSVGIQLQAGIRHPSKESKHIHIDASHARPSNSITSQINMSDLPRYELIPSHDADVKSPSGARPGDEESGWHANTASTSTMVAPARICYSFNPEYPVPGKAEDVVGIRGTSKEVSPTTFHPFGLLRNYGTSSDPPSVPMSTSTPSPSSNAPSPPSKPTRTTESSSSSPRQTPRR
jgi:hypothetical protein